MRQTMKIGGENGKNVPVIGTEYKSSLLLQTNDTVNFRFFNNTESGALKKYVETDNPFPQGGVIQALQFTVYEQDFSPVDLSFPTHTYARLAELGRMLHFLELTVQYGDSVQFENRKLERFMTLPVLAKPYLASGTIAASTPVAANLVWPERAPAYAPPNGSLAVSGMTLVGQGGRGIVLDADTALDINLGIQKDSNYQITSNLNNLIIACEIIGPRFSTSGVTSGA